MIHRARVAVGVSRVQLVVRGVQRLGEVVERMMTVVATCAEVGKAIANRVGGDGDVGGRDVVGERRRRSRRAEGRDGRVSIVLEPRYGLARLVVVVVRRVEVGG